MTTKKNQVLEVSAASHRKQLLVVGQAEISEIRH
jgi:hypothetical protein